MGKKADWIAALDAATAPIADEESWARSLLDAMKPLFGVDEIGFAVIDHSADGEKFSVRTAVSNYALLPPQEYIGRYGLRKLYYPPRMVTSASSFLESGLGPEAWSELRACTGAVEAHAMFAHPEPGTAAVMCAVFSDRRPLDRHRARRLTQVALHLEAGLRLRRRPQTVKAVLRGDGRVIHLEPSAPPGALLTRLVRDVERARQSHARGSGEALDLWQALVQGELSLVARTEGTRREYLAVENPPARQPLRAFTVGEVDAISLATRGLSAKAVSYALGISESRVSSRLASAAAKVGIASRIELVRLAAMLTRDPRARFAKSALTAAERDVLELLSQGLSNAEIARFRNRSVRTIANQVAELLRKTSVSSRRALVTRTIG